MTKQVTVSVTEEIKKIDQAIKAIEAPLKEEKTSGKLTLPGGQSINVHTEKSVARLIETAGYILAKQTAYDRAADALGLKTYPKYKFDGSTAEAWLNDIQNRIALAESENKLSKLKEAKKQLEQFLSEEEQKEKILSSIKDLV